MMARALSGRGLDPAAYICRTSAPRAAQLSIDPAKAGSNERKQSGTPISSMESATSSPSDAAPSSSSRHDVDGTSASSPRSANFSQGAELMCTSPSPDAAEHAAASCESRARPSDGDLVMPDCSSLWDSSSPLGWIKAFLVALLVLQAVSSSGRRLDARAPAVESVWPPANATRGTDDDLCSSSERSSRCKRCPEAGNGTSTTRDAHVYQDVMCSDNVGELLEQSSGQQNDDDVQPMPWPSENLLLLPQSADENVATSSLTMTDRGLGGEDNITLMEAQLTTGSTDHAEDETSVSGNRGVPDGRVEALTTGLDISMDASMGEEQPVADDQTRCAPWSPTPGFRFLPTDLEIVLHFLKHRILNLELPEQNAVRDGVNVHSTNADDITLDMNDGGKERLGFFFVRKEHAYANGCWCPTPGGYWKLRRGQPAAIRHGGRVVAFKTSMDYVRGRAPYGRRTPWSMSEYALNARHHDLRNLAQPTMNSFVVCKVWKRTSIKVKTTPVLRRHGLKNRAARDLVPKPKVRRLVGGGGVRGGILGKRKHPELFWASGA